MVSMYMIRSFVKYGRIGRYYRFVRWSVIGRLQYEFWKRGWQDSDSDYLPF